MPTSQHETMIEMFRQRPTLAADLLVDAFDLTLPEFEQATLTSGDAPDLVPTEYRADAVVILGREDAPALAVVIEVQLRRDPRKHYSWPVYLATLRARLNCPTVLMAVSTNPAVATWCATPISLGHPDWVLVPLTLGPDRLPVISDPAEAARNPELAVLSLLAHPDRYETVPALLSGFESLGEGLRELYADLVLMALPLAARRHLEDLMKTTEHKYGSSFARGYFDEGRAEGRAEGLAEATVGTKAEAILAVLRARGFDYSEFVSNDIRACTDVEQLDLWLERAATVTAVEDLFDL